MGKTSRARVLPDSKAKAVGTMIRTSPRKLNLVAQTIRGKKAGAALNELTSVSYTHLTLPTILRV